MEDWQAKQAMKAAVAKALRSANPHLVPADCKGGALVAAAKNIRIELKRAFPSVKFSVKSERYSGGDSINVGWIDGPSSAQVDLIVKKYQGGSFNGMEDIYEYADSRWNDAFGDAKYVFSQRSYSDKAKASALRLVAAKYGLEPLSVENYNAGKARNVQCVAGWHFDLGDLVYQAMARQVWALNKAPKAGPESAEIIVNSYAEGA